MLFRQLFDAESSTYTYLLADEESREAVLIDPVLEKVDRDLQLIQDLNLTLKMAINTHCHADHITGTGEIKKRLPSVQSGISRASGAKADVFFDPNYVISLGKQSLQVLATPGHTAGCVTYYTTSNAGMAFTGDTVLVRGCGRTDFQGGGSEMLYDSVHSVVFKLPPATTIYPAHDYKGFISTTVEEEVRLNPRLSKGKQEFVAIMAGLNLPYPKKIDAALPANLVCGLQD